MKLIDIDTLKQNLCGDCTMNFPKECRQIGCAKVDKKDILEALRLPIIDAVPVIRCKDCRHWDCDDSESYCRELGIFNTDMNSYCSYAKRKEHETN